MIGKMDQINHTDEALLLSTIPKTPLVCTLLITDKIIDVRRVGPTSGTKVQLEKNRHLKISASHEAEKIDI